MDGPAKELISRGDDLFAKKIPILSLWQAANEQFYPEAADYTYVRSMGMEFASHLMTGVPAQHSRDLSTAIQAMCRPPGQVWFHPRTNNAALNKDNTNLRWLDYSGDVMMRAFNARLSGFSRGTKEGDRDFCVIGNVCISIRPNKTFTGLSFRARHMRDVAFAESYEGFINEIHVKTTETARNVVQAFPNTAAQKLKDDKKNPYAPVSLRHIVLPSDEYDGAMAKSEMLPGGKKRLGYALPWVSLIVDTDNEVILEEVGQHQFGYVTPRWSTKPGFVYGYSPPSIYSISDARMLQQITLTLLEAGQKAVDPPMKAVGNDVIQGGVNLFAGGVSWIDPEYDERTGTAIEPLWKSNPNLNWGVDRETRIADVIAKAHFLNQIKFPDTTKARTAYETQKMWTEFVRSVTPLFEPIQVEYNAAICDESFIMLSRYNAFGPRSDIPRALRGQEITYEFETPVTLAQQSANAQAFTSVGQLTALAVQADPSMAQDVDWDTAFRDALIGAGAPATWIVPKMVADMKKDMSRKMMAQQQMLQQGAQTVGQVADAATKVGQAAQTLQPGQGQGAPPPGQAGKIGAAANMLQFGGAVPQQMPQVGGLM